MAEQFNLVEPILLDPELFVDNVNEDLICIVCHHVILNAVNPPCGHIFCSACLARCLNIKQRCPVCRRPIHIGEINENAFISLKISGLKIKCKKCSIVTLVGNNGLTFLTHVGSCCNTMVECNLCKTVLPFKDIALHRENCFDYPVDNYEEADVPADMPADVPADVPPEEEEEEEEVIEIPQVVENNEPERETRIPSRFSQIKHKWLWLVVGIATISTILIGGRLLLRKKPIEST